MKQQIKRLEIIKNKLKAMITEEQDPECLDVLKPWLLDVEQDLLQAINRDALGELGEDLEDFTGETMLQMDLEKHLQRYEGLELVKAVPSPEGLYLQYHYRGYMINIEAITKTGLIKIVEVNIHEIKRA